MKGLWIFVLIAVFSMLVTSFVYLCKRIARFACIQKLIGDKGRKLYRLKKVLIPFLIIIILSVILSVTINSWSAIIVLIHLSVIWMLCDLVSMLIRRIRKTERKSNIEGIVAIILTTVYISIGIFLACNVWETRYTINTDKQVGDGIRVALISDSHIGTTFDGEGFAKYMKEIEAKEPDVLIIAGDYVDDDSNREDMERSCKALGEMKTKYGVYYCFGNHDKGYYGSRDFNTDDLRKSLEDNGVKILEDEAVLIDDTYYIVGRQDKTEIKRLSAAETVKSLDKSKYIIMVDHQPNDYDAEKNIGVDMVLSGHTHGGQFIPIDLISDLFKLNDKTYGLENIEGTDFLVSSGISDWAIPIKTGTKSEYVIIDIKNK